MSPFVDDHSPHSNTLTPVTLNLPTGVHFVGSLPLSTNKDALSTISTALPNHIRRIPDGETGDRWCYVMWQSQTFRDYPYILHPCHMGDQQLYPHVEPLEAKDIDPSAIKLPSTGYDSAAITSYAEFLKFREQGVIPERVKFQVSLPTAVASLAIHVKSDYQALFEPAYEAKIFEAFSNIQAAIPAKDLAIQIDIAIEVGFLENVGSFFTPWFGSGSPEIVRKEVVERIVRQALKVHPEVELGLHLCYGDIGHRPFIEPECLNLLVSLFNELKSKLEARGRRVQWVHLPVPKSRDDAAYFEALKNIDLAAGSPVSPTADASQIASIDFAEAATVDDGFDKDTELYIGLVHERDEEGTKKRIETVQRVMGNKWSWGVATGCGLGRVKNEDLDGLLNIFGVVSQPLKDIRLGNRKEGFGEFQIADGELLLGNKQ